jgi:hypothetical protein
MKRLGFTILAAAALTLPLGAQTTNIMHANIPFEFVVGKTTAPAGTYVFSFPDAQGLVCMRLVGTEGRLLVTSPGGDSTSPKLVFHRYGNQYFLSQIGTTSRSSDIPPSRIERELKKTTLAAGRNMQTEIVLATP